MNGFDERFYEGFDDGQPINTCVVDGVATSEPVNNVFITPEMDKENIIEE